MIKAIRVLYICIKEGKKKKRANINWSTQVTHPQNLRGGILENRSREGANDSFGPSQDAKRQKGRRYD